MRNQSLWWANQKHSTALRSIYYTLFTVHRVSVPSASHHKNCAIMWSQKTIFLSQTCIFWLFFIQLYCGWSHSEHHWRRSYVFFAMEHVKGSHLWWFYVFFCTKLWILPIRELCQNSCTKRPPLWLCSQDLVWFHLAQRQ